MIQLLYTVILVQMALILTLLFKTPLRKLVIITLDRVKRGTSPVMVKTVGATVFVVLTSSVYSVVKKIQNRTEESTGLLNPIEQVSLARHMPEAFLMGFLLFLSLIIGKLHHYIRELRLVRKTVEATKKHNRGMEDEKNSSSSEEEKAMGEEIPSLVAKLEKRQSEYEAKPKDAKAAEHQERLMEALQRQCYILWEDNNNLLKQFESMGGKKKTLKKNKSFNDANCLQKP